MTPSPQQQAIYDWFRDGTAHLIVRARAGTGKTTTIIEGINFAPERSILLAAFNKRIADELGNRVKNPCAKVQTLHAAGFACVRRVWERTRVDNQRLGRSVRAVIGEQVPDVLAKLVGTLATKAKEMLPFAVKGDELTALAARFDCIPDIEWAEKGYDTSWACTQAAKVMEHGATTRDGTIDFADMLFLPVRNDWVRPTYDLICVDEAQDMAATQLELAMRLASGRIAVVGDDKQAIYAFRGADAGALDRLKVALNATELGLTTTYRCPAAIVAHAATLVPDFTAHSSAPAGIVSELAEAALADTVAVGDFVLSRKNAPLAGVCLRILRTGKRARIEGRDVGQGMLALIRKLKTPSGTIADLSVRLARWRDLEISRALALGTDADESRAEYITDQAATIDALCEGLEEVIELTGRIENLFADDATAGPRVVCSTVHKAKGLEADRVFILRDTLYPFGVSDEERNIEYVACTRAKNHLTWVSAAGPMPVAAPAVVQTNGGDECNNHRLT